MPNGTDVHVGFLVPQSKHIWDPLASGRQGGHGGGSYFVGWLGFEFREDILRLCLRSEGHGGREKAAEYELLEEGDLWKALCQYRLGWRLGGRKLRPDLEG